MNDFWTITCTWADGFTAETKVSGLYLIGGGVLDLTGKHMDHGDLVKVEAV